MGDPSHGAPAGGWPSVGHLPAAIVDSSADAILATDVDGIITAWNPAAERLYGYSTDDAVGTAASLIVPPEDAAPHARALTRVLAGTAVRYDTVSRLTADGARVDVAITMAPMRDERGIVVGAVSVERDVTHARAAETAMRRVRTREASLVDELDQTRRLESLGQLAAGVAHDFNNLLGVIINYAHFVADALPTGSQALEDIGEVRRAAEGGATLTRRLLIFSRREVAHPEVIDMNALVLGLGNLLRRALGERVRLDMGLADGLWRVSADRGQLEQVLVNLAVNGRDAMPEGGILTVQTENVRLGEEYVGTRLEPEAGAYVLLKVIDDGTGMSTEVATRAFEPFFTTKPRGEGTGLGLATVYGIVTDAGGKVALHSEAGHGTSVKVYLPSTTDPPDPRRGPAEHAPAGRGEVVLIVEDQAEVRRMAERILSRAGYEVLSADGGALAVELAARHDVALVLTDVVMPGMTGPELVEQLRARRPTVRVLFMSGYSHRVLSQEALGGEGTSMFIEKPFTAAALLAKVRELLDS